MEALQRLHNRGSISTGYGIENSLKVEADNSEYAEYAITSTTDRRNFCFSGWVKRTELVNATDGGQCIFGSFTEGNEGVLLRWSRENSNYYDGIQVDIGQGGTNYRSYTSSLYRDTSAWYHIVLAVNTRENTASDRWKLYVNGEQVTSWAQQQFPTADFLTSANLSGSKHTIGAYETGGTVYGKNCGYFADFHFIDADQGDVTFLPTDFGEFDDDSNIWKPKAYAGSYGTNGFYLDFSDSANLGDDASGNSNDFTETNITAADQATDTPTNNFTTFNIARRYNQGRISFTEGGTVVNTTSGNAWTTVFNTMAVNKGKWYWEGELYTGGGYQMFGQTPQPWTEININIDWYLGQRSDKQNGAGYYGSGADVYYEGGYVDSAANATGDIISVAMDCDNNKVHFAVNGVYTNSSNPVNNTNGFAMLDDYQYFAMATYIGSYAFKANFGGYTTISISSAASDANGYGTFEYAPPSGYYALCTKNLEEFG